MKKRSTGSKGGLINDGKVIAVLRDNIPTIPFPNTWDLLGGGNEGNEDPLECWRREIEEEIGVVVNESQVIWEKEYAAETNQPYKGLRSTHFFVAEITDEQISRIRLGEEGQKWELMPIEDFLSRNDAVPYIQNRLNDWFEVRNGS